MHPLGHEVHPQPEQESICRTVFAGRVRFGGVFRRSLRATTKKRSSAFLVRKSAHTPRQNPGYACGENACLQALFRCQKFVFNS